MTTPVLSSYDKMAEGLGIFAEGFGAMTTDVGYRILENTTRIGKLLVEHETALVSGVVALTVIWALHASASNKEENKEENKEVQYTYRGRRWTPNRTAQALGYMVYAAMSAFAVDPVYRRSYYHRPIIYYF